MFIGVVFILFFLVYVVMLRFLVNEGEKNTNFFETQEKGLFMFDLGVLDSVMSNHAKGKKLRSESQHQKIRMEMTS